MCASVTCCIEIIGSKGRWFLKFVDLYNTVEYKILLVDVTFFNIKAVPQNFGEVPKLIIVFRTKENAGQTPLKSNYH